VASILRRVRGSAPESAPTYLLALMKAVVSDGRHEGDLADSSGEAARVWRLFSAPIQIGVPLRAHRLGVPAGATSTWQPTAAKPGMVRNRRQQSGESRHDVDEATRAGDARFLPGSRRQARNRLRNHRDATTIT